MSHTPGPWRIGSKLGYPIVVIDDRLYASVSGYTIAELPNMEKAERIVELTNLIAAAPELLEACKIALGAFERNDAIDWNDLTRAIAKAEGK